MKLLVVANWKMNPLTLAEAKEILQPVEKGVKKVKSVEVVICPPVIFIKGLLKDSSLAFGSQNLFWLDKGAYTGEISALMLKNLGCSYAIIGHSERRFHFLETDTLVNKKIKAALATKIGPIICVGESEEERKGNKAEEAVVNQLTKGLSGVSFNEELPLNIAYEPAWAIGMGNSCDFHTARDMRLVIKETLKKIIGPEGAEKIRILYGGSVNKDNAHDFVEQAGFDGLLVGGASLKPEEFVAIVKSIQIS